MTGPQLKQSIRAILIPRRTITQEIAVLDMIIDFIVQASTSGIPAWTSIRVFNADGTGDGAFCTFADVTGALRFWNSKINNNVNHAPPNAPGETENAYWKEVSPSSGSAIQAYAPGLIGDGLFITYYNDGNPALYVLKDDVPRPFNSVDLLAETAQGKWIRFGGGGSWGSIDGNIEDQADLVAYVAQKIGEAVTGLYDDRGNYDPTATTTYPASGGSGHEGAILKGDIWTVSVAGTIDGIEVRVGDTVRALVDAPGSVATNWSVLTHSDSTETPVNVGSISSGTLVIDGKRKNHYVTLTGPVTIDYTNLVAGREYTLRVERATNTVVNWASNKWAAPLGKIPQFTNPTTNGSDPANAVDIVTFKSILPGELPVVVITPDKQNL